MMITTTDITVSSIEHIPGSCGGESVVGEREKLSKTIKRDSAALFMFLQEKQTESQGMTILLHKEGD